jgi:hypothetical protein
MPDALEMWKKLRLSEAYEVAKTAVVVGAAGPTASRS